MSRRKAREMAVQTLFSLEFNKQELDYALDQVFFEQESLSERSKNYAIMIVNGVYDNLEEIDKLINQVSMHWKIERMGVIDRNIARMAIYEMQYSSEKLSPNVVINEAVEVAKVFGGEDSARFINGILGNLVKSRE